MFSHKEIVSYAPHYLSEILKMYQYSSQENILTQEYTIKQFKKNFIKPWEHLFILKTNKEILGAINCWIDEEYRFIKSSRIDLFYLKKNNKVYYKMLLDYAEKRLASLGFKSLYYWIVLEKIGKQYDLLYKLGFKPDLYSNDMIMKLENIPEKPIWPKGIKVVSFERKKHEGIFIDIINTVFKEEPDFVEYTSKRLDIEMEEESYMDGGFLIVFFGEIPIGCVRIFQSMPSSEQYKIGYISSLGISPSFQSRGLGKKLLQESLYFLYEREFDYVELCVHNPIAQHIYLEAGFKKQATIVKMSKDIQA